MTEEKQQPPVAPEPPAVEPEPMAAVPESEPAPEPKPAPSQPPRRGGRALALLALLLALAAGAGTGYLWWQERQRPEVKLPDIPDVAAEVERRVAPLQSAMADLRGELTQAVADLRSELDQSVAEVRREAERLSAGRDGVDRALARIEEDANRRLGGLERRLTNLEGGLAALADARSSTTAELALAETEFLLRSANERLQLFNDPRGAQTALGLAEARLESVDDPIYSSVRQTLAGHVQALRSVELPDRVALSGRLLALAGNSVEWPLDARRSLQVSGTNLLTPSAADAGLWQRFKEVLSSVVVVHREKQAEAVLLTLEEERLLRENVRLQLQVAQLAAVRGEQSLYESAIDTVSGWLGDYYDGESALVADALAQLTELGQIDLNPDLPDIGAALKQLRSVRAANALAGEIEGAQ